MQKVVLHKAENPWMPQGKAETTDVSAEEAQTIELYRKFQGILNKLTPQKFQTLAEQALKLEINTEERLSGCVEMVFYNVSSKVITVFIKKVTSFSHGCLTSRPWQIHDMP